MFGSAVGAANYLRSVTSTADMGEYYVDPLADFSASTVVSSTGEKKNLILIYLESIEDTFSDDQRFETNMLESVQNSTDGWSALDGLQQVLGGGWTMSGIVSTQCGIPLRAPIGLEGGDETGQVATTTAGYLPNATCLGDVLAANGYTNVFLGGADSSFASKRTFLTGHGYDEVKDLDTWRTLGESEMREDWGLSDNRLLERAKEEVLTLHQGEAPFNLTVLTLDSHDAPYLYDNCPLFTDVLMTSVITCSMEAVADFVDFLGANGVLEDTAVVLMGDHLKLVSEQNSFWDELGGLEDRTIFSRVWDPSGSPTFRSNVDQLSVYPTVLDLLDIPMVDQRAGLGVSAFATEFLPGSPLLLSDEEYAELLNSRSSEFYAELWNQPEALVEAGA